MTKAKEIVFNGLKWMNITTPSEKFLRKLQKQYNFHNLCIKDCLKLNQRAKIDDYDEYLFIVLHFPDLRKDGQSIEIEEIDMFITPDVIITVNEKTNELVAELFRKCEEESGAREEFMSKGSGYFLYKFISKLLGNTLTIIENLEDEAGYAEVRMFEDLGREDMLAQILALKKDIIQIRRAILPERAVIAQLQHKNKKFIDEKLEVYFEDMVDQIERVWNQIEELKDTINSVHKTNESLISHNISQVMKFLTIFSVIILPLTFITGMFGMNVKLPFGDNPLAFSLISGIMLGLAVLMFFFFKYKRWL